MVGSGASVLEENLIQGPIDEVIVIMSLFITD